MVKPARAGLRTGRNGGIQIIFNVLVNQGQQVWKGEGISSLHEVQSQSSATNKNQTCFWIRTMTTYDGDDSVLNHNSETKRSIPVAVC